MWRKPEEYKPQSALDALPSTLPAPQRPAAAAPVSSNAPACVTQGIKIKGEVSGREDFVLDGEFEGKIHIADGIFTVGLNARVNAEIEARKIIVRGEVIGTLKARERVQVRSTRQSYWRYGDAWHRHRRRRGSARQGRSPSKRPAAAAARCSRARQRGQCHRIGAGQTRGAMTHGINKPRFPYERPPRDRPGSRANGSRPDHMVWPGMKRFSSDLPCGSVNREC
jgi:Polymer-forming cytoskeletal